jgi:hypothetical protein
MAPAAKKLKNKINEEQISQQNTYKKCSTYKALFIQKTIIEADHQNTKF